MLHSLLFLEQTHLRGPLSYSVSCKRGKLRFGPAGFSEPLFQILLTRDTAKQSTQHDMLTYTASCELTYTASCEYHPMLSAIPLIRRLRMQVTGKQVYTEQAHLFCVLWIAGSCTFGATGSIGFFPHLLASMPFGPGPPGNPTRFGGTPRGTNCPPGPRPPAPGGPSRMPLPRLGPGPPGRKLPGKMPPPRLGESIRPSPGEGKRVSM